MFSKTLFIFVIVNVVLNSSGQRAKKFFRKDYNYIEAVQSFYKVHTIPQTWTDAKRVCAQEGATLWHPDDEYEARELLSFWIKTKPKITWMYVGLSDILVEGVFITVEGKPLTEVYNTWELHEPNNAGGDEDCVHIDQQGYMNDCDCDKKYNFICKKSLKSLEWNYKCNMPNLDYTFSKDTGKCYKLHTIPLKWTEASAMCEVEHTSLAMVSNQLEAFFLVKLMETTAKPRVQENYQRGIYHLGFHNRLNEDWQTLKGSPVNVDDDVWFDNYQPKGRGQCGSMFYTGRLINTDCDMKCLFICEHEPEIIASPDAVRSELPLLQPYVGGGVE